MRITENSADFVHDGQLMLIGSVSMQSQKMMASR